MQNLETREDIEKMVQLFYNKVKADASLAPLFQHVHWPDHLPIMYNFWGTMLLGDLSYHGQPLAKHLALPLDKEHFQRWIELFHQTIDEHFMGEKALEARQRATTIAMVWKHKLGLE